MRNGRAAVRRSWQGASVVAADDEPLLPASGAPVTLVIESDRVRARVIGADTGRLDLSAERVPEVLQRAGTIDGRIEFVADRGPCRLIGTARLIPRSEAEEDVRFEGLLVRFSHESAGQLLLRSEKVRAPFEVEIGVEVGDEARTTRTLNMRGGGALIRGPLKASIGDRVRYFIFIPGRAQAIEGDATVARITEDGDVAIQFGDMGLGEREDILLAVFEALRGS
jgi:PilZ domain